MFKKNDVKVKTFIYAQTNSVNSFCVPLNLMQFLQYNLLESNDNKAKAEAK